MARRRSAGSRLGALRCALGMAACAAAFAASRAAAEPAGPPAYPSGYRLGAITLPAPGGRYPVGTRSFELARADGTPLPVVAWYPAARADGVTASYFTADEARVIAPAFARIFGWPATMLDDLAGRKTHALAGAPVARGRFPLLIFSHGFLMYARQNSALMERLAAAGYIVLSVSHPGDAADMPSSRGTLPTRLAATPPEPDAKAIEAFWAAPDRRSQRRHLPALWASPRVTAMQARLESWRADLRIATDAMTAPSSPMDWLAGAVRPGALAYLGMSFGGSASVSACVREPLCVAAVNLDGIEFDDRLYDRDAGKPVLLIQSDWRRFPNAGPPNLSFTSYDHAYERWDNAGRNPDIHRYRLKDIKHLGMSDLILAPRDTARDALFGPIDGGRATEAINALTLAFVDRYVARRGGSVEAVARRHPDLVRHSAGEDPSRESGHE